MTCRHFGLRMKFCGGRIPTQSGKKERRFAPPASYRPNRHQTISHTPHRPGSASTLHGNFFSSCGVTRSMRAAVVATAATPKTGLSIPRLINFKEFRLASHSVSKCATAPLTHHLVASIGRFITTPIRCLPLQITLGLGGSRKSRHLGPLN